MVSGGLGESPMSSVVNFGDNLQLAVVSPEKGLMISRYHCIKGAALFTGLIELGGADVLGNFL